MIGARTALALGGFSLLAAPAAAVPIEVNGTASLDLGYTSNPNLQVGLGGGGSATAGFTLQSTASARDGRGLTSLSGLYTRSEYITKSYDPSETLSASLSRSQSFSERLSGSASVSYTNSRNSFLLADDIIDTTTLGARRQSIGADASLQWQATSRDVISFSAFGSKAIYTSDSLNDYRTYGASAVYRRTLNARTSVGVSGSISRTETGNNGDTTTYSPRVVLNHQFDAAWKFDGSLGLLLQKSEFGFLFFPPGAPAPVLLSGSSNSKSIGFDANLCRTHPRTTICFTGSRDTVASGLGGARTATSVRASYSYTLSERESLNASVSAVDSKSVDRSFIVPKERYLSADLGYRRTLTRRFDGGLTAGYRLRDLSRVGSVDGFTVALNLIAKFGRLK